MQREEMRTKKIFPLLVSMSLPMVISMLVNALYNIVDSYFIAGIDEDAMTAISLVFPLQNIVNAVSVGFGVGVNAAVAYYLGADETKRAENASSLSVLLALAQGIILAVSTSLILNPFINSFTDKSDIISYSLTYGKTVLLFSPLVSLQLVYQKLFQAVGQVKIAMSSMMVGCIVNIILDPLMIYGLGPFPKMGIWGAAIATGIGQATELVIYLICYSKGYLGIRISASCATKEIATAKRIYKVGIPATLNMAMTSSLITMLNRILAPIGAQYVLVLGVYYKLQMFLYLPANGIVQGLRPLVAYNSGAKEHERVMKFFRCALLMILVIMALGTLLSFILPEYLIGLFTDNPVTILEGGKALKTISLGFIASAVTVTISGTLEGLGKGLHSLLISFLRYVVVIVPIALLLSKVWGALGVFRAFWINELIVMVLSILLFKRMIKKDREASA